MYLIHCEDRAGVAAVLAQLRRQGVAHVAYRRARASERAEGWPYLAIGRSEEEQREMETRSAPDFRPYRCHKMRLDGTSAGLVTIVAKTSGHVVLTLYCSYRTIVGYRRGAVRAVITPRRFSPTTQRHIREMVAGNPEVAESHETFAAALAQTLAALGFDHNGEAVAEMADFDRGRYPRIAEYRPDYRELRGGKWAAPADLPPHIRGH